MKKFLLLLTPLSLVAQTIEIKSLYQAAPLIGDWKQQTGDDPRWSSVDFDDSTWTTVNMPQPSLPGAKGFTWHRIHILLPQPLPAEPLFILVGPLFPAYEIFANGKPIGHYGGPFGNPHGQLYARPAAFALPRESRIMIAIRSEDFHLRFGAQSASAQSSISWIGAGENISDKLARWQRDRKDGTEPLRIIAVTVLFGSIFFIVVALIRRRNFEYLWIGIFMGGNAIFRFVQVVPEWVGNPDRQFAEYLVILSMLPTIVALVLFCRAIFKLSATWICYSGVVFCLLVICEGRASDWVRAHALWFDQWGGVLENISEGVIYGSFAWPARRRFSEFWVLHLAFALYVGSNVIFYSMQSLGGMPVGGDYMTPLEISFRLNFVVFLFGMGVILSLRSAKSDQEQGRLLQEMAAAGEVQELLLAAPAAGGIDAVYLPASEVGGDFYHVQSYPDGSHVALVGDVSGKGLKAAMVVSVVIGALQSQTATTPEGILSSLNRALKGRVGGGFATCCCFRIESGGRVTIASAGHPAPYCDGREIEMEAGLPLGLVSEVVYNAREFQLELGEQITLVSDGVLEAENREGELFGFERTREISGKSAQEIADAAKAWGQNDDITVVTVRRVG